MSIYEKLSKLSNSQLEATANGDTDHSDVIAEMAQTILDQRLDRLVAVDDNLGFMVFAR